MGEMAILLLFEINVDKSMFTYTKTFVKIKSTKHNSGKHVL